MAKLDIKIKINQLEELKSVIEYIKTLNLSKTPELNPEITVEFGYDDYFSGHKTAHVDNDVVMALSHVDGFC